MARKQKDGVNQSAPEATVIQKPQEQVKESAPVAHAQFDFSALDERLDAAQAVVQGPDWFYLCCWCSCAWCLQDGDGISGWYGPNGEFIRHKYSEPPPDGVPPNAQVRIIFGRPEAGSEYEDGLDLFLREAGIGGSVGVALSENYKAYNEDKDYDDL